MMDPAILKRAIQEQDWKKAARLLAIYRKENPNNAQGWYWTAVCLENEGKLKEACRAAKRAAELDENHGATRSILCRLEATPETMESGGSLQDSSIPATEADSFINTPPATEVENSADQPSSSGALWKEGETVEDRYEVRQVMRGGMGEVAFVFDRELDLELAVKTPLPRVLASTSGRNRFIREAEAWIALGLHPNICTAFYLRELGGFPRLFIEYIDGGSLRNWLKFQKNRNLAEKLDLALQIASGMEHAHSFLWTDSEGVGRRGIVHRDLKPANILLGSDGLARVTDFGLVGTGTDPALGVEISEGSQPEGNVWGTITMGGSVMGTPPYMPPEQWKGAHLANQAADIYAFGVILFEIFCGLRPFSLDPKVRKGRPELQLLQWKKIHLGSEPRNPISLNPGLDGEIAELMLLSLAKDESERPESFAVIGEILRQIYARVIRKPYPRPRPRASRLLADSLNNRGVSYHSLHRESQALKAWKEALEVDPHHREAGYNLALFRWRFRGATTKETDAAISELGGYRGNPEDINFSNWKDAFLRSRILILLEQWEQATETLKSCLKISENSSRVALDYALALCARADLSLKETPREITLQLGSRDEGRDTMSLQAEKSTELWKDAAEVLSRCGGPLRHDTRLLVAYALASYRLDKKEAAHRLMNQALKSRPDLPRDVEKAAAKILPGLSPRHRLESVGSRVQQLEMSVEKNLAVALLGDNRIAIWELESGKLRRIHKLPDPRPRCIALDAARNLVYTAREVEAVSAVDLRSARVVHRLSPHSGFINDLAISSDGRKILGVGTSRNVYLWNLDTHQFISSIPTDIGYLTRVDLALDCRRALVGGSSGTAILIDLECPEILQRLEGPDSVITALAISPGARQAVVGNKDGQIKLWKLDNPESPRSFHGHDETISFLSLDNSSEHLLSGGRDGSLRLWEIGRGLSLRMIPFEGAIQNGAASTDFSRILVSAGTRNIWSIDFSEKPEWIPNWAIGSPISAGAMESKANDFRKHLVRARRQLEEGSTTDSITSIEAARQVPGFEKMPEILELNEEINRLFPRKTLRSDWEERVLEEHDFPIYGLAVGLEGSVILSAGADRRLRLHQSGKSMELGGGECCAERSIRITRDGGMAFSGGLENNIHVWDLEKAEILQTLEGHTGQINSLDLRFDEAFLLSASADGSLRYWDTSTGICLKILEGHTREVLDCAFHPSGDIAASCGDEGILLWDLSQGVAITSLEGHRGSVRSVRWTGDGRKLISAGADGMIRLWNPKTGKAIQVLNVPSPIEVIVLGDDDRFLFSGDRKGEIRLWDLRSRKTLAVFSKHRSRIHALALSGATLRCFSASADGSLRIWYLDWIPDAETLPLSKARAYLEIYLHRRKIHGRNLWAAENLDDLRDELQEKGFGKVSREDLERELQRISRETDRPTFLEELELGQALSQKSPIVQKEQKSLRKLFVWGGIFLLPIILLFLSALPPSGPTYSLRERMEIRSARELDTNTVMASVHTGNSCDSLKMDEYIGQLRDSPSFEQSVQAAHCISELERGSLALEYFEILRSSRSSTGHRTKQKLIMTAFLTRVPESECRNLAEYLDDPDESVRNLAAESLALNPAPLCSQLFLSSASQRDPLIRTALSAHFSSFVAMSKLPANKLFPYLEEFTNSAWPGIRRNAALSLMLFQGKAPRRCAEKLLKDEDPEVRRAAQFYLINLR